MYLPFLVIEFYWKLVLFKPFCTQTFFLSILFFFRRIYLFYSLQRNFTSSTCGVRIWCLTFFVAFLEKYKNIKRKKKYVIMKRKIFYFLESTLYFYSYTYSPITNREKGNIFLAKIQEFSFAFSKKKKNSHLLWATISNNKLI